MIVYTLSKHKYEDLNMVNETSYNDTRITWTTDSDESGVETTWFTMDDYPDISFAFTNFEFGDIDPNQEISLSYKLEFKTEEQQALSVDSEGFDDATKKLLIGMVTKAEEIAKEMAEQQKSCLLDFSQRLGDDS
jgi:hypothetical protein